MKTTFDELLKENSHFNNHPEMLPYIGENYANKRILIISESHFVPKNIKYQPDDTWYSGLYDIKSVSNNSNTRDVMKQVFLGKGHILFSNLSDALKQTNSNIDLRDISWYNFFQKPAAYGVSIKPTDLDIQIALEIFEENLNILKPKLVVFISTLSFKYLNNDRVWSKEINGHKYKKFDIPIGIVPHPTSVWWNKKSKLHNNKTGKQKFIDIINDHIF